MRIITISRQFGSGGRELGRRLADVLDWDYYDREIIGDLARKSTGGKDDIGSILSSHGWRNIPLTFGSTFSSVYNPTSTDLDMLIKERQITQEIAKAGQNFVVVGRDADVILKSYEPFNIFVCASDEYRLTRCLEHENRKPESERLSEKQVMKLIKQEDANRRNIRRIISGTEGEAHEWHLSINTTHWSLEHLAKNLADLMNSYFDQRGWDAEKPED